MIRVKLPFGGVTPEQMDAFADLAEHYTPLRKGHITTRQNFQFHHIPLPDAAKAIRMIGEVGLSSREACGNTVRNVTGDPWAGVSEGELFDPTPYVGAFVRYFVRNEVCQLLPRKFKVAFTSDRRGPRDHAASTTSASSRASARSTASRSRASRSAPAAARRSCRASAARSGSSRPSTTAST